MLSMTTCLPPEVKVPGTEVSIKESDLCEDDTDGADSVVNKMLVLLDETGDEWNMVPGKLWVEVATRSDDKLEMEVDSTSLVMCGKLAEGGTEAFLEVLKHCSRVGTLLTVWRMSWTVLVSSSWSPVVMMFMLRSPTLLMLLLCFNVF